VQKGLFAVWQEVFQIQRPKRWEATDARKLAGQILSVCISMKIKIQPLPNLWPSHLQPTKVTTRISLRKFRIKQKKYFSCIVFKNCPFNLFIFHWRNSVFIFCNRKATYLNCPEPAGGCILHPILYYQLMTRCSEHTLFVSWGVTVMKHCVVHFSTELQHCTVFHLCRCNWIQKNDVSMKLTNRATACTCFFYKLTSKMLAKDDGFLETFHVCASDWQKVLD
jgi:hypothetical protein